MYLDSTERAGIKRAMEALYIQWDWYVTAVSIEHSTRLTVKIIAVCVWAMVLLNFIFPDYAGWIMSVMSLLLILGTVISGKLWTKRRKRGILTQSQIEDRLTEVVNKEMTDFERALFMALVEVVITSEVGKIYEVLEVIDQTDTLWELTFIQELKIGLGKIRREVLVE